MGTLEYVYAHVNVRVTQRAHQKFLQRLTILVVSPKELAWPFKPEQPLGTIVIQELHWCETGGIGSRRESEYVVIVFDGSPTCVDSEEM